MKWKKEIQIFLSNLHINAKMQIKVICILTSVISHNCHIKCAFVEFYPS